MVPFRILLYIVCRIEDGAACCLGDLPGAIDVSEMLLEIAPVLVGVRLVAPLLAVVVELIGVGNELEGDEEDPFVRHVIVNCLGVGLPVLNLSFHLHEGGAARPRP